MANAPVGGIRQTPEAADSSPSVRFDQLCNDASAQALLLSDATAEAARSKGLPYEIQVPGPRAARDDGRCCRRTRIDAASREDRGFGQFDGTVAADTDGAPDPRVSAARSRRSFIGRNPPARARRFFTPPLVRSGQRSRFNPLSLSRRYGASGQHERDGSESGDRGRWLQGRSRARPWIRRRVEGKRAARSNRSAAERRADGQRIGKLIGGFVQRRWLGACPMADFLRQQ